MFFHIFAKNQNIMQKFSLLFSLFLLFSCTVTEKPEFVKLDSIKVANSNSKEIELVADAHFLNKNSVGGKLQLNNIKVLLNETEVAVVNSSTFQVPKKEEFTIPISVKIPHKKLFKKNKLTNVLNMLIKKEVAIQYKGIITYKLGDFSYDYPL